MAEQFRPEIPRFDEKAQQEILNLASRLAAVDAGKVTQTELEKIGEDIGLSSEHVRTAIGLYEAKKPALAPRNLKSRMLEWVEIGIVALHFFVLTTIVGEWMQPYNFYYRPDSLLFVLIALCLGLGLLIRGKATNLYRSAIVLASSMAASLILTGLFQKLKGVPTTGSNWPKLAVYVLTIELVILGASWIGGRLLRGFVRMLSAAYQLEDKARP